MILPDFVAGTLGFEADLMAVYPSGATAFEVRWPERVGVLPGSFNPLHEGHRRLRQAARDYLGLPVYYELSVLNVDKPALDAGEVERRLGQFGDEVVLVTRAAWFADKARLLPGSTFVVGYDTAARVLDPSRYRLDGLERQLAEIREYGCRFVVGAREIEGVVYNLDGLPIPPGAADLFWELPLVVSGVSSTSLREKESA